MNSVLNSLFQFRELTDPSHAKISEIIINSYM